MHTSCSIEEEALAIQQAEDEELQQFLARQRLRLEQEVDHKALPLPLPDGTSTSDVYRLQSSDVRGKKPLRLDRQSDTIVAAAEERQLRLDAQKHSEALGPSISKLTTNTIS